MSERMSELPQAEMADPDGVQVALRAAHTLWSHGDTAESLRWLRRAAESASDEGADVRSLELAKAAAELRTRLAVSQPPGSSPIAGGLSSIPAAKQAQSANGWARPPASPPPAVSSLNAGPGLTTAPESVPPPLPNPVDDDDLEAEALPDDALIEKDGGAEPTPSAMQAWLASDSTAPGAPRESAEGVNQGLSIPPPLPSESYQDPYGADEGRSEQLTLAIDSEQGRAEVLEPMLASSPAVQVQPAAPSGDAPPSVAPSSSAPTQPGEAVAEITGTTPKLTARVHHQAVRVAIAASSLGDGQFTVRPLREGETAPAGERVALLVALEPGSPLV